MKNLWAILCSFGLVSFVGCCCCGTTNVTPDGGEIPPINIEDADGMADDEIVVTDEIIVTDDGAADDGTVDGFPPLDDGAPLGDGAADDGTIEPGPVLDGAADGAPGDGAADAPAP